VAVMRVVETVVALL